MKMEDKKLHRIMREFNKWRYPECRAIAIKNGEDELIMQFDGTFAHSCCFDEHFEDFRIMMEEEGEKFVIKEVKHIMGKKFIVKYEKKRKMEEEKNKVTVYLKRLPSQIFSFLSEKSL